MPEKQQIIVDGHQLYVESYNPPNRLAVILLHHGLGSSKSWRALIPALIESGYFVIAYDRWGYGRSDPRSDFPMPSFEQDRKDLEAILSAYNLLEAILIGHSDGGTIGLLYAEQAPQIVRGLVTIAAHIYVEDKMVAGIEEIHKSFEEDLRFREGLKRVHGDKFEQVFYTWYNGWYRDELRTWNIHPKLNRITCPTLVIQGTEDEHATSEHARDLSAQVRGSQLWLLSGAGHMLPQEYPEIFNQRVLDFLSEIS